MPLPVGVTPTMQPLGVQGSDGSIRQGLFVAPPIGMKFDDVALFFVVDEIPWMNEVKDPQLIFVGGFDAQKQAFDHSIDTEFLTFAYPCTDYEDLRRRIGTIDFVSGKTQGAEA